LPERVDPDHRRQQEQMGGAATPSSSQEVFRVARTTPMLHPQDELGQTMAEYAVILTVITAVILFAIVLLATNLGTHITNIAKLIV
jgi:Flp pilus assembly pilin Flp